MNGKKAKKLRKAARAMAFVGNQPVAEVKKIYKQLKTIKTNNA
jgi:hypothetical protein